MTLRGKGVPRVRASGRGDLHVHVEVLTPTKLDAEQEERSARVGTAAAITAAGIADVGRGTRIDARVEACAGHR